MMEIVWLTEERLFAELVNLGAHASLVRYTRAGNEYEVYVDNDEFEYREEDDSDEDED